MLLKYVRCLKLLCNRAVLRKEKFFDFINFKGYITAPLYITPPIMWYRVKVITFGDTTTNNNKRNITVVYVGV